VDKVFSVQLPFERHLQFSPSGHFQRKGELKTSRNVSKGEPQMSIEEKIENLKAELWEILGRDGIPPDRRSFLKGGLFFLCSIQDQLLDDIDSTGDRKTGKAGTQNAETPGNGNESVIDPLADKPMVKVPVHYW
jgi:hypothetical protein